MCTVISLTLRSWSRSHANDACAHGNVRKLFVEHSFMRCQRSDIATGYRMMSVLVLYVALHVRLLRWELRRSICVYPALLNLLVLALNHRDVESWSCDPCRCRGVRDTVSGRGRSARASRSCNGSIRSQPLCNETSGLHKLHQRKGAQLLMLL